MKSIIKLLAINLAVLSAMFFTVEVAGQILFYLLKGHTIYSDLPYGEDDKHHQDLFEYHPYQVGRMQKNVVVEFNGITMSSTDYHTRTTGSPENDDDCIRIAARGGSTTFGTKVTDSDSWPAQLQTKLGDGYSVRNYGGPGFSTAEAIVQLAMTVPEWKPHYVIVYQGWNDIRNYHDPAFTPDYYSHGVTQVSNLRLPFYWKRGFLVEAAEISFIFKVIGFLNYKFFPYKPRHLETVPDPDPRVDAAYERNLKTLKVLSEYLSAEVIFVPQILNDAFLLTTGIENLGWANYIRLSDMPRLMSHFNEITAGICESGDQDCYFVESVLNVDWQESDFVDRGHFSAQGGDNFSDELVKLFETL